MTGRKTRRRAASAGFTLIELLISLALFALISLAGVRLVETVATVQDRTAGRAARLAELQRGIFLITADFEQLSGGPQRDGDRIAITRPGPLGKQTVGYQLRDGALHRIADGADRAIISGVRSANWRFFKNGAWIDQPTTTDDISRPQAVELTIELDNGLRARGGRIRRVFELAAER